MTTLPQKLIGLIPRHRIRALADDRLLRNMGWMGLAQILSRVFRIGATIVVARTLAPDVFGLAAIVIATHELVSVLARRGTVSHLVQAPAERLHKLTRTAYWMNWILCASLFLIQAGSAYPVSLFYANTELALPLLAMAVSYLMLPFGMVHTALNLRANRMDVIARSDVLQALGEALLTIALALAGFGLWALVLPKVAVTPVWVLVNRRAADWQVPTRLSFCHWQSLLRFSRDVTGIEILTAVRNNLDYLLVGYFLGIEALGIYYFAYNAGLGISLGLIHSFGTAVYPHLCEANAEPVRMARYFRDSLRHIAWIAIPLILLQAGAAAVYVPLLYGSDWVEYGAIPLVVLLCLSALPRPFAEVASQLLLAAGHSRLDLIWNLLFTLLLTMSVLIGVSYGASGVACAILILHLIALPAFTLWSAGYALRSANPSFTPATERG